MSQSGRRKSRKTARRLAADPDLHLRIPAFVWDHAAAVHHLPCPSFFAGARRQRCKVLGYGYSGHSCWNDICSLVCGVDC